MLYKAGTAGLRTGAKLAVRGAQRAAANSARQAIRAGQRVGRNAAQQGVKNYAKGQAQRAMQAAARSAPGRALARGYGTVQRAGARVRPHLENMVQLSQIAAGLAPYVSDYGGERGKKVAMILDDQTKYKVGGREMSRAELMTELAKADAAMAKMEAT